MRKWRPNVTPALTIFTPQQPAYKAGYRNLTTKEKTRFRGLLAKLDSTKTFCSLEKIGVEKLCAGTLVGFELLGHLVNRKITGTGIVWKRRGPEILVITPYRLFAVTLNQSHQNWQKYRQRLAIKKAERFISKQRNTVFRNFLRGLHENRKSWQFKRSEFAADATAKTNERWPKKHKVVSKLLNLLRYAY